MRILAVSSLASLRISRLDAICISVRLKLIPTPTPDPQSLNHHPFPRNLPKEHLLQPGMRFLERWELREGVQERRVLGEGCAGFE